MQLTNVLIDKMLGHRVTLYFIEQEYKAYKEGYLDGYKLGIIFIEEVKS